MMKQIIILSVMAVMAVGACPSACSCNGNTVYCNSRQLTVVPQNIPHSTQKLDLDYNQLTSLPPTIFASLTQLTVLSLDGNQLTSLSPSIFTSLTQLTHLLLNSNQLTSLSPTIFTSLTQLTDLGLHGNQLTSLSPSIFSSLTQLTDLNLYSNQLTSLPPTIFSSLTQLTYLDLYSNQLTSLSPTIFSSLTQLTYLSLDYNHLTSLPPTIFASLTKLTYLGLDDNQLTSLSPTIFASLTQLMCLSLNGNQLTSLPPTIFASLTQLTTLYLGRNPLICCRVRDAVMSLPLTPTTFHGSCTHSGGGIIQLIDIKRGTVTVACPKTTTAEPTTTSLPTTVEPTTTSLPTTVEPTTTSLPTTVEPTTTVLPTTNPPQAHCARMTVLTPARGTMSKIKLTKSTACLWNTFEFKYPKGFVFAKNGQKMFLTIFMNRARQFNCATNFFTILPHADGTSKFRCFQELPYQSLINKDFVLSIRTNPDEWASTDELEITSVMFAM